MRTLKHSLLLLVISLLVAGCGSFSGGKTASIGPIAHVKDSRQIRKRQEYQETLLRVTDLLERNELEEALRYARRARRSQPKNPDAYTLIAVIESQRGRETLAGNAYRKAFDLAPQRGDVVNNYGAWLCSNGYPAEALVLFDRALMDASYESRADAMANAGGCALSAGQIERAEHDLKQALELNPDNAYALESMARYEAAHQRWFDARAFYQRRLGAAPASVGLLQLAIEVEQQLGNERLVAQYQQQLKDEFSVPAPSSITEAQQENALEAEAPPLSQSHEMTDHSAFHDEDAMIDQHMDDSLVQDSAP